MGHSFYLTFFFVSAILATHAARPVHAVPPQDSNLQKSNQAPITRHPHVVSIYNPKGFECVGSIVSENHVVTTAGCANVVSPDLEGYLRAGSSNLEHGGSIHKIDRVAVHEAYNYSEVVNDIALIRVAEPFEFDDTRQIIELFRQDEDVSGGSKAVVAGWGDTESGETLELREYNVKTMSPEKCGHSDNGGITDGEMCAVASESSYSFVCLDEADPLVVEGRLAGLASWGSQCDLQPYVYTKVAHYRNWIDKHIRS